MIEDRATQGTQIIPGAPHGRRTLKISTAASVLSFEDLLYTCYAMHAGLKWASFYVEHPKEQKKNVRSIILRYAVVAGLSGYSSRKLTP